MSGGLVPKEPLWTGLEPPYRTIVADPPWTYEQGGPMTSPVGRDRPFKRGPKTPPYPMMSVEDIASMPVHELAAADAHLYLWTTSRYLKDAHEIVKAWGFRYSQTLTWCKKPMGLGPGGAYCNTTEYVLFCRRGKLAPLSRSDTSWWLWPRRAHSVKPFEFFDVVEKVSPGPHLDLFARGKRPGWDGWGNEYACGGV